MDCTKPFYIVRPDIVDISQIKVFSDFVGGYPLPYTSLSQVKGVPQKMRPTRPDVFMAVGCGKCLACRKQRTREWSLRLLYESTLWDDGIFLTLTYDDENVPLVQTEKFGERPTLVKKDFQNFFKRLRKKIDKPIKYFGCGEYGSQTFRSHYHAIIFGLSPKDVDDIKTCWSFGFVDVKPIGLYQICYVAGYVQKKLNGDLAKEVYQGRQAPFQLQSQGLGLGYAEKNAKKILLQGYCGAFDGTRNSIPRYFSKKEQNLKAMLELRSYERLLKRLDEISEMSIEEFNSNMEARVKAATIRANELLVRQSFRNSKL